MSIDVAKLKDSNEAVNKLLPHFETLYKNIVAKISYFCENKTNSRGEILYKTPEGDSKSLGHWALMPENGIVEPLKKTVAPAKDVIAAAKDITTGDTSKLGENSFIKGIKTDIKHHAVKPRIVYADGEQEVCLRAISILLHEDVITPMLLGDPEKIRKKAAQLHIDLKETEIINPKDALGNDYAETYFEYRKHKGISMETAKEKMKKPNYYGAMMVEKDAADGMVSGLSSDNKPFIPAFEIIKTSEGVKRASSVFFMIKDGKPLIFADCSMNIEPDAKTLAEIGAISGDTAKTFNMDPKIAFLSFSTKGSAKGPELDKVVEATAICKRMRPNYKIDGEIQFDAALLPEVAKKKCPESELAGDANVFIFPDLNSGNIGYKIAERLGGYKAVGPVFQGLNKPVNDLSRGAEPEDVADLGYISAKQAISKIKDISKSKAMNVLVINAGSSSLKYQLIDMSNESVLAKGLCDRIGMEGSIIKHTKQGEETVKTVKELKDHKAAIEEVLKTLCHEKMGVIKDVLEIAAVGHRVVHGGEKFKDSVIIDDNVMKEINAVSELAPLHNPPNIVGIEACKAVMPKTPMVAVFDTAFHQNMPDYAYLYAIPYDAYKNHGIRKYGFHGTSHKFVSERGAKAMGKNIEDLKLISCHLGNGASVCAIKGGKSIETSMGLTPLAGLAMGTRSGDLDPAIIKLLMEKDNMSISEVNDYLNKKSGVLGVSGLSSDFRDLEMAAKSGNKRAMLAIDLFCYRVKKYIGEYASVMNGVDGIIFTAGIGENSSLIRNKILAGSEYLGIQIDDKKNEINGKEAEISKECSKVKVLVIPTNEELAIAKETKKELYKLKILEAPSKPVSLTSAKKTKDYVLGMA